ncbi:unnamed protein product, partial [Effrenium voratum]
MILAFEGGAFLWPGVEVGFVRNVTIKPKDAPALDLQITTRSLVPLVVEISSFLGDEDCQHVINKALPHIQKSAVKHMDHDVGKPDANWRTSSTYFMPSDDEVLHRLDERVSALTVIPKRHQELAQILRYEKGERYVAHNDYFDSAMYAKNADIQKMIKKGIFNRLATVFFYLSDVAEGGETNFPRAGGKPQPHDFDDCSKGVSVTPRRGRIIIFYSLHPSGQNDPTSLHGGCEVKDGTKWSANKWIWNKPMDYIRGLAVPVHEGEAAFVQGFLSAPWHRAPAVQRLALELSLNGAGEAVAELLNALPALRSLQLGPSCSLDADVLASLASAQALAQLTCLEFEGARAETWSLAPLVSSARQLQVLDLSDSDFGDADAQQLAAASLGPLLLSRLAFRRCRLRTPAGAVAVARILNSFGKVRHFSIQANAWRAEAHRAFAEQLAAPAAEGLLSLQAGYGAQPVPEARASGSGKAHTP